MHKNNVYPALITPISWEENTCLEDEVSHCRQPLATIGKHE